MGDTIPGTDSTLLGKCLYRKQLTSSTECPTRAQTLNVGWTTNLSWDLILPPSDAYPIELSGHRSSQVVFDLILINSTNAQTKLKSENKRKLGKVNKRYVLFSASIKLFWGENKSHIRVYHS